MSFDHYNPRTQLKHFSDKKGGVLYRFDNNSQEVEDGTTDDFGGEDNFYTEKVEVALQFYENDFDKVINKLKAKALYKQDVSLTPGEISMLLCYLAVQINRTPRVKKQIPELRKKVADQNPLGVSVADLLNVSIEETHGALIFGCGKEAFEMIKYGRFSLAVSKHLSFVLPDNGFAIIPQDYKVVREGTWVGLTSENTSKFFPLTKNLCLIIENSQSGYNISNGIMPFAPSEEWINIVNGALHAHADQYVYGCSEEVLLDAGKKSNEIMEETKLMQM